MRDISLTGDFFFATVFQALEESVQKADQMTKLNREHAAESFQDEMNVLLRGHTPLFTETRGTAKTISGQMAVILVAINGYIFLLNIF